MVTAQYTAWALIYPWVMVRDAYSKVEETTHRSFLGRDLFFFPVKEEQLILDADVAGELLVQG